MFSAPVHSSSNRNHFLFCLGVVTPFHDDAELLTTELLLRGFVASMQGQDFKTVLQLFWIFLYLNGGHSEITTSKVIFC